MRIFKNAGFMCITLLCWAGSVSAYQEIPVECVVELVKNDAVVEKHSGSCGYAMPFVVTSSTRKIFRSGVGQKSPQEEPELIKKEVRLGFSATVYVGNNLTLENPQTVLMVDYSLVHLEKVEKHIVVMAGNKIVELEIPTINNVSSSGASLFKKREIQKVGAWFDGHDTYQIRIGIR
ncbi:MAG: hypothetical protein WA056_14055 [Gallionella sp.]